MIIGTKSVDDSSILLHMNGLEAMRKFSDSLVPRCLRHIEAIVYNQRYFIALRIRKLKGVAYDTRKFYSEGLVQDIYVTGTLNSIVDFQDILVRIDISKLTEMLDKEEQR